MGFFDKAVNFFVETDPKTEEEAKPSVTSSQPTSIPASPVMILPPVTNALTNQPVNDKFKAQIEGLLQENDLPGIDYLEFANALNTMSTTAGLTEDMRVKLSFNTLKAVNKDLTKEMLLSTSQHYIDVLEKEEKTFDSEMTKEVANRVTGLQQQAKNREKEIEDLRAKMLAIQTEIEAKQAEINQMNIDSQSSQTKINFAFQEFKATVQSFKNVIENNRQLISKYL